eukprot:8813815-Prorocentrum_lima.AAC.1
MLRGGWQVGAGADASTVCVQTDRQGTYKPNHIPGRRRLRSAPAEEANKREAKGTEPVLGRS